MASVAERQDTLAAAFDARRAEPTFGAAGAGAAREAAFARFADRGFPTTRDEEWRFTNIAPLASTRFVRAAQASVTPDVIREACPVTDPAVVFTLVNGRLAGVVPALPAGLSVRTLANAQPQDLVFNRPSGATPFVDLNAAFCDDVLVIDIAPKAIVPGFIVIQSIAVHEAQPVMVSPRVVVNAGEASQASIVEIHVDTGTGAPVFVNMVMDVMTGPAALLDHVKLQQQSEASFHLASVYATTARTGTFTSHALTLGGGIARNDIISVLGGEGAECTLNGLYVAGGESLVDTHTTIDHAKAHCPSHEVYKGILTGRARAVFNGKIFVRLDAQKTDAKQTNKALLLTDEAQVNTKPQLEIFADDVKCTHGAAIGQLDEDALFYLKARGIGAIDARNMLIHAFAGDVLDGVKSDDVREAAMRRVEEILGLPH